jgi:2-polyprenyl-3-methyl-5-hydroxy-6-metoxy-1,4-benzoquinol methylase
MSSKFDISLYNDEFFKWHQDYTIEYQEKTFQWYIDNFRPKSVIDFGCGIGTYLHTAYKNGIHDLRGIDIAEPNARKYIPEEIQEFIEHADCTKYVSIYAHYSCAISFETAEHIDPSGTDMFVSNIIKSAANMILFTAAPPGQQGCGHIKYAGAKLVD